MTQSNEFKKVLLSSPHCTLGKSGVTDEFISHVNKLLKRYKIIKIKALRSIANSSNIKELAEILSQATKSVVLDIRGKMIILSVMK